MKIRHIAGALAALGAVFANSAAAQTVPDFTSMPGTDVVIDGNVLGYSNAADLDGDGIDEVILTPGSYPGQQDNALSILKWTGAVFQDIAADLISPVPTSEAFTDVLVEDFDRNGRSDVFIGAFGYDDTPFPGSKNFLLLQKAGQLKSVARQIDKGEDTTYFSTAGDINNDRVPDIFQINLETKYKDGPHFALSKRKGRFETRRDLINPDYAAPPGGQAALSSAAIADIDNDGKNDLIVGRENGLYVGVYFNKKGYFKRSKPDIKLPALALGKGSSHPLEIEALDFDLDGFIDIVVFCAGWPSFQPLSLQFYRNIKGEKFRDVTSSVLQGNPTVRSNLAGLDRLHPVDFHGDGLVDLIGISERGSESSSLIFMNDGAGHFSEYGWEFFRAAQGHAYRSVIPANLNDDNRTDLVTGYISAQGAQSTYHVEAFLNDGVANIDVTNPPTIVRKPKKTTVKERERLFLSVLVQGDRPFTYRWMKNGATLFRFTGPTLEISKAKTAHKGKYSVEVSNAAGTVVSPAVRVRVK